jgi:hypothetical protein
MSVNDAIIAANPTSYWPLDDAGGSASCRDELGLHSAAAPSAGVTLSAIPFGAAQAPLFDGQLGSVLTIPDDPKYSQPYGKALTVAVWLCPLALDNKNVIVGADSYVHYVEKAVAQSVDAEWALRFYDRKSTSRPLRLSFYTFNLGSPTGEGNGSYMQYGHSTNDETPIDFGKWIFVVGQAEPWISPTDLSTGCALWKQGVAAKRETPDKYGDFGVRPHHGAGSITVGGSQETGFKGAIAHLAIWNRLLGVDEIAAIWSAGASDLEATPMYHSFV